MAKCSTSVERNYSLRNNSKSVKFYADGTCSSDSCKNCTLLNVEINKLRRQIALLLKQNQETVSDVNTTLTSSVDISSPSSEDQDVVILENNDECCSLPIPEPETVSYITTPYDRLYPGVATYIDISKLDSNTKYTHNFSSRAVAYYGEHPYSYTGGYHKTNPFSDNPYLVYILESVQVHFPKLRFNSAMVTKYENGTQGIPPHSDHEESISPGSMICTISLGETRTLEFRSTSKTSLVNSKVRLAHGDILFMTRWSQNQFEHCIPKDYTKGMRVSITLRHLISTNPGVGVTPTVDRFMAGSHEPGDQPSPITSVCSTIKGNVCPDHQRPHELTCSSSGAQTSPVVDTVSTQTSIETADKCLNTDPENTKQSSCVHGEINKDIDRSTTVYISSSMFRHLDCRKLSSKSQDAHVFAYPGATVEMMKEKFCNDIRKNDLDTSSINNIMLMCGSNNIDSILESPKDMRNSLLMQGKPKSFASRLDQTNK